MNTPRSFFYTFLAIIGVLMPYIWLSGFVAYLLDCIVRYLAGGREKEIVKLIKAHTIPLELEIERLKNELARIENK
jgi:hypothetical protein